MRQTSSQTEWPTDAKSCCSPGRSRSGPAAPLATTLIPDFAPPPAQTVDIPGGPALVGTASPGIADDGEGPLRRRRLRPFRMSATTVSNADFAAFLRETGYRTEAERFGWSFVFAGHLPAEAGPTEAVQGIEWWRKVDGAMWSAPQGPGSSDACLPDHPVVHVSWHDAQAYAAWAGGRLPTEAEWEHAARGGRGDVPYPWGDEEPDDSGFTPCNIWQGAFPTQNTALDGYAATAPVRAFAPNGYGLFNMAGNVWEWTEDAFRIRSLKKRVKERLATMKGYRVSKGGSFLCHRSYCHRYRIAARSGSSPDSTTSHQGFRVVWDKGGE